MKLANTATLISILFAALVPDALTLSLSTLEDSAIFTPPVLFPHSGTVWIVGQHHNVTWNASNAPANVAKGTIVLAKDDITTPLILADGFNILLGRVEVTVPWVVDGADYQVVWFGDSGDRSEDFTITGSGITS